jgi:hypothetical protein
MKTVCSFLIILLLVNIAFGQKFIRDLPSETLCSQLRPENYKNVDAVIVLKEQSFLIGDTEIDYRNLTLKGLSTTRTHIMIVKLFNEAAVERYGSFEYTYPEYYGDDMPNGFDAKARVLKENGKVWVMNKKTITRIVARETSDGIPLARKVLFKIPNLTAGDIVQIEYQFTEVFSRSSSALFYYSDRDFVLFSNLYITLPMKEEAKYISLPEQRIGQPKVEQLSRAYGSGKTYVWMLQNLNPIPDEPYSLPFSDRSLITAFIVEKIGQKYMGDWDSIAKQFYDDFLDKDKVSKDHLEQLGYATDLDISPLTFQNVDQLYAAIRKKLILTEFNSLYPASDKIGSVFKSGKGDASDLAYIMFNILQQWGQNVNIIWIRDQRKGIYEKAIPSTFWFDRLGVLVTINGQEKAYDFDRCIPCNYTHPSFLKSNEVVALNQTGCFHKKLTIPATINDNITCEMHTLNLDSAHGIVDNVMFTYKGVAAEKFRGKYYDSPEDDIKEAVEKSVVGDCLSRVDSLNLNNLWDESEIRLYMSGVCNTKVESIENFLTFKLKNKLLDDFKSNIFSAVRWSDIYFDAPFQMNLTWQIDIPEGYQLNTAPVDQKFDLEGKAGSNIIYRVDGNDLKISANLKFHQKHIPMNLYPKLIGMLDDTIKEINKDIVLKKM